MAQTDGEAGTGAQESDAGVQKSRPSARCLSRGGGRRKAEMDSGQFLKTETTRLRDS